jgi:hypothetical protein
VVSKNAPLAALLPALFVLVYLANLDSLRLVRDDWANIAEMSRMLQSHGLAGAVERIVTNAWLSSDTPRIFCGAWLVQLFVGYLGRYDYIPYYLFILGAHFCAALLMRRIWFAISGSTWLATLLAAAFLVAPSATNVLFWLNNWFFALPFDILVLQVYVLLFPRRSLAAQIALLLALTAFGQLCGEQTILMFYWSLVAGVLAALRFQHARERVRTVVACASAAAGAALVMIAYVTHVMKFSALQTPVHPSFERSIDYLVGYKRYYLAYFDPASYLYGSATVPVSAKTVVLIVLCLIVVAAACWPKRTRDEMRDATRLGYAALGLCGYVVSALLPLLYGAYTGARPGPATRYVFCGAIPMTLLVLCVLAYLAAGRTRVTALARFGLAAFVAYCASLIVYSMGQVWGFQKTADAAVWRAVDRAMTQRTDFVVTANLTERQAQLMPHWYSDAVSDFQADWGIFGRLYAVYGRSFSVGKEVRKDRSGGLRLLDYYGGSKPLDPRSSGIYLAYRYGSTFESLAPAKLYVFTRLEDFETFKRRERRAKP